MYPLSDCPAHLRPPHIPTSFQPRVPLLSATCLDVWRVQLVCGRAGVRWVWCGWLCRRDGVWWALGGCGWWGAMGRCRCVGVWVWWAGLVCVWGVWWVWWAGGDGSVGVWWVNGCRQVFVWWGGCVVGRCSRWVEAVVNAQNLQKLSSSEGEWKASHPKTSSNRPRKFLK